MLDDDGYPEYTAFLPREGEGDLSTNWMEYFNRSSCEETFQSVRGAMRDKRFRVARTSVFAVVNVGAVKDAVSGLDDRAGTRRTVSVQRDPRDGDESHAVILGFTSQDEAVADAIRRVVLRLFPGRSGHPD